MPIALAALAVVTAVHLVAQLIAPEGIVADTTQVLLMPALAAALVMGTRTPRPRLVRLVLVALFFSWLGDTLPRFASEDVRFLVMVGCFLLAQVAYVVAFWPMRRESLLRSRVLVVPYALAFVALVLLCRDGAGSLLAPVVVYGLALEAMAVLATGLGRVAGIGGAVFFVSDSLIALDAFADIELPAHSFWVMLAYVVGQALLVAAVRARAADPATAPGLVSTP